MTNKSAPTQRQRDEQSRRIAMGIAVIQKPLRHIRVRCEVNEDFAGFVSARRIADRGNGQGVKAIARGMK